MKKMNRRTFIKGSAAIGAAAATISGLSVKSASAGMVRIPPLRSVDLTATYQAGMPSFDSLDIMFKVVNYANFDTGNFYMNIVSIHEHLGTHIDAPVHRIQGGKYLPEIPYQQYWMVPAAVIDITEQCAADADYQLTVQDITAWERRYRRIPKGAWVVVYTGWFEKASNPTAFFNADANGTWHFPGVGSEAANFLVTERDINGVALDVTSVDRGMDVSTGNSSVHVILLSQEVLVVENLINLDQLPPRGAYLSISPLLVDKASGGPVRVIAALP